MELYEYQKEDVAFLKQWGRSMNMSEMGVGKTPTAVRLLEELNGLPGLIVCPSAVKYHWEEQIKTFWKGEDKPKVYQYRGKPEERRQIDAKDGVLVVNYELFRQDFDEYFKTKAFKMTIFDEAHRLKNRTAKVTKCAYKLKTEYIHLVTGTPITNQFDDLYSYLHLLFPSQFKNYWKFVYRYGIVRSNGFGKEIQGLNPERANELGSILRQFTVRRKKADVLPFLPDKTYSTIYVDLLPEQRRIYEDLRDFMLAELETGDNIEVPSIIAQLMKLRQVALSTSLVGEGKEYSAKKQALLEILQDRIMAGKKTVVMSEFKRWIDNLEETLNQKGMKAVRLTGQEKDVQKQQAVKQFQEGDADVILCTIKAAGTGIDLTAADMMIFTDISWTDVDNRQAEDRIHRASQTKKVQIVKLFAKETIDDVMLNRTLIKALTAQHILDQEQKEALVQMLKRG
mgnify:CR=1 FL=1